MKHVIRIAAACLDLPPLAAVAAAMARSAATAGGTEFHKPTFDGRMSAYERRLVTDAKAGRLIVSDQFGGMGTVDEIVQRSKDDGVYSEVFAHVGGQVDQQRTLSLILYASLPQLNAWGAGSGDSFVIDSTGVEWIDERGIVTPPAQPEAPLVTQWQPAPAESKRDKQAGRIEHWLSECERRAAELGEPFDRNCMPGKMQDFRDLLHALDAELRSIKSISTLRDNYTKKHKMCKWPANAGAQPSALPLYSRLFPESTIRAPGVTSAQRSKA